MRLKQNKEPKYIGSQSQDHIRRALVQSDSSAIGDNLFKSDSSNKSKEDYTKYKSPYYHTIIQKHRQRENKKSLEHKVARSIFQMSNSGLDGSSSLDSLSAGSAKALSLLSRKMKHQIIRKNSIESQKVKSDSDLKLFANRKKRHRSTVNEQDSERNQQSSSQSMNPMTSSFNFK